MTDVHLTDTHHPSSEDDPAAEPVTRPRRRRVIAGITTGGVLAAAVIAVLAVGTVGAPQPTVDPATPISTVPVTTGDMVAATNAKGTLHYAQEGAMVAAPSGVVTALPAVGAVITPGAALYGIDTLPVMLLRGTQPVWRSFELGMTPGEDVRQLEENLVALGVPFSGDVDTTFTQATATAVSAWQKSLGVERTGRLDRSAVVFSDHDVRVARATVALGAQVAAGAELYRVSATDKVVDLDLRLADQQLAVLGTEVGLTLPDGTTTTGTIAAVAEPLERTDDASASKDATGSSAAFVVPVTVTLADQAAVGAFPRASVTVQFSSTLAAGVLTVPVEALVATDARSFAVETTDGAAAGSVRRIPVTVGAFASGRVEISGSGVREGLAVVVPES